MDIIYTCYKVTNIVNGKLYIGITQRPIEDRWQEHIKFALYDSLDDYRYAIHRAMIKYGVEAFVIDEIAVSKNPDDIKWLEKSFIREYNTFIGNRCGYNMTYGGDGTTGHAVTEETRRKMSLSHIGKSNGPHNDSTKQKIRDHHLANNHKPSQLCIDRRRELCSGVARADDVKERIRQTLTGRPRSAETIAKIKATKQARKLQNGSQT